MAWKVWRSGTAGAAPSGTYLSKSTQRYGQRGAVMGRRVAAVNKAVVNPNFGGLQATANGTPLGNPNWSCAAGPEMLATAGTTVPVDPGTGYIFGHHLGPAAEIANAFNRVTAEFDTFADVMQHFVSFDLYRETYPINNRTEAVQVVLPLRNATKGAGAVLNGGAANTLDALEDPLDGKNITMDGTLGNSEIRVYFDPTELETNWPTGRITRMGIRYIAWRDDGSTEAPSEGFTLSWIDSGTGTVEQLMHAWLVANHQSDATYETRWIGETNLISRGRTGWPDDAMAPFTVQDLINGNAVINQTGWKITPATGSNPTAEVIFFDFIQLVVEVVPERRASTAIRMVGNIYGLPGSSGSYANDVEMRYPLDSVFRVDTASPAWMDMYLLLREAEPGSPSDYYRVRGGVPVWAPAETYGPSLELMGVKQERMNQGSTMSMTDSQLQTFIAGIDDGQVIPQTIERFESYNLAVASYTPNVAIEGSFWAGYRDLAGLQFQKVFSGTPRFQRILVGPQTYDRIRVLLRPDPLVNDVIFFQLIDANLNLLAESNTVSRDDIYGGGFADVGNGFYEVLVSIPPTTFTDVGYAYLQAVSGAGTNQPWYVSAAEPIGLQPYFSYDIANDGAGSGTARIIDYAMVLICEPEPPAAPTVTPVIEPLDGSCEISTMTTVEVCWTSTGEYDQYGVVFRTPDLELVAVEIVDAEDAGVEQCITHRWVPWDVDVEYAIVGWRIVDQWQELGDWAAPIVVPSQGAVLGITGTGSAADIAVIYAPSTDSGAVRMAVQNLNSSELLQLAGEPYNRVLTTAEDRGRSFTVPLLVKDLGICSGGVPDDLPLGSRALALDPYNDLHDLQRCGLVYVTGPDGIVRSCILQVGGMVTTMEAGIYAADVTLISAVGGILEFTLA